MDGVNINLWAVLLGGVSSMAIGMLYYSDNAFGKEWKKLAKIDEKRLKTEMNKYLPWVFASALVTALVVAYFAFLYQAYTQASWISSALIISTVVWLAVSATVYAHNAFDQRPIRLTAISVGNRLLVLLAIGLIIGWLHP
ncbi:MAG: DUF1761 domain-containing protein [Patescibacteria group bacterium]